MIVVRLVKVLLVVSTALFAFLVAFDNVVDYGTNYAFVRQARPLLGEPTLQLPVGVYIQPDSRYSLTGQNTAWNTPNVNQNSLNIPTSYDTTNFDIIFNSSGEMGWKPTDQAGRQRDESVIHKKAKEVGWEEPRTRLVARFTGLAPSVQLKAPA